MKAQSKLGLIRDFVMSSAMLNIVGVKEEEKGNVTIVVTTEDHFVTNLTVTLDIYQPRFVLYPGDESTRFMFDDPVGNREIVLVLCMSEDVSIRVLEGLQGTEKKLFQLQ